MDKWRHFIFFAIGIVVTQTVVGVLIATYIADWTSRGQFGDMFGAVNTLFSGLAFAGVIFAIILQKQELRLQREELSLTREELKRTACAQEKSEEALSLQAKALMISAQLAAANCIYEESQKTIQKITSYTQGSSREAMRNSAIQRSHSVQSEIQMLYDELKNITISNSLTSQ